MSFDALSLGQVTDQFEMSLASLVSLSELLRVKLPFGLNNPLSLGFPGLDRIGLLFRCERVLPALILGCSTLAAKLPLLQVVAFGFARLRDPRFHVHER